MLHTPRTLADHPCVRQIESQRIVSRASVHDWSSNKRVPTQTMITSPRARGSAGAEQHMSRPAAALSPRSGIASQASGGRPVPDVSRGTTPLHVHHRHGLRPAQVATSAPGSPWLADGPAEQHAQTVLSTLTLSPSGGVSRLARRLLETERGMKTTSSEDCGPAETWGVMKVLHNFAAVTGDEHLTIKQDDAVVVQFVGQRGWSYGRVIMNHSGELVSDSRAGWFPSAYVTSMDDNCKSPPKNPDQEPSGFVTAVQGFQQARMDGAPGDLLHFRTGEIVAVWEEGNSGWLLGSVVMNANGTLLTEGKCGWFTAHLTTRFPPPLHLRPSTSSSYQLPVDHHYSPFGQDAPSEFSTQSYLSPSPARSSIRKTSTQIEEEKMRHHSVCAAQPSTHSSFPLPAKFLSKTAGGGSAPSSACGSSLSSPRKDFHQAGGDAEFLNDSDAITGKRKSDMDLLDRNRVDENHAHGGNDYRFEPRKSEELSKPASDICPSRLSSRKAECSAQMNSVGGNDRSVSPQYRTSRSLSAIDDVTLHVTVTFTREVLDGEGCDQTLRRLAASLITSICRRLDVSERRFKVARCSGKSSIVLDVLPFFVVSPSEAGAELSASQLSRKIVGLSREDHGWVATMTQNAMATQSGYSIQADVMIVEMNAAEAAALREQQMNDLSSTSTSLSSHSVNENKFVKEDLLPDSKTPDIRGSSPATTDDSAELHDGRNDVSEFTISPRKDRHYSWRDTHSSSRDGNSRSSSQYNTPRILTDVQNPRIALRVVEAENLPMFKGVPSILFVALTIQSDDGEITFCTGSAKGNQGGNCGDGSVLHDMGSGGIVWNDEFIIDVQPDSVFRSKLVVDVCERNGEGQQVHLGYVEPAMGLEDLMRAREYSEWLGFVDAATHKPLLGANGRQARVHIAASFRPTQKDPFPFNAMDNESRSHTNVFGAHMVKVPAHGLADDRHCNMLHDKSDSFSGQATPTATAIRSGGKKEKDRCPRARASAQTPEIQLLEASLKLYSLRNSAPNRSLYIDYREELHAKGEAVSLDVMDRLWAPSNVHSEATLARGGHHFGDLLSCQRENEKRFGEEGKDHDREQDFSSSASAETKLDTMPTKKDHEMSKDKGRERDVANCDTDQTQVLDDEIVQNYTTESSLALSFTAISSGSDGGCSEKDWGREGLLASRVCGPLLSAAKDRANAMGARSPTHEDAVGVSAIAKARQMVRDEFLQGRARRVSDAGAEMGVSIAAEDKMQTENTEKEDELRARTDRLRRAQQRARAIVGFKNTSPKPSDHCFVQAIVGLK